MSEENKNTKNQNGSKPRKNKKKLKKYLRSLFRDWDIKVMSYVMIVVVVISVIAATVAWFTFFRNNRISGMGISVGSADSGLKVAMDSNGPDIDDLKAIQGTDSVEFSINMPLFDNVENYMSPQKTATDGSIIATSAPISKMAPGVYGEVTMYLTSLNQQVDQFRITPSILLTYSDDSSDRMDETTWTVSGPAVEENDTKGDNDTKKAMRQLVQGHILFFKERKLEENGTYTYSGQISPKGDGTLDFGPLEDTLEFDAQNNKGIEKMVTVYWCWVYEYDELPDGMKTAVVSEGHKYRKQLFSDEDVTENENWSNEDTYRLTQLYDYADTKIATNVKSMRFHFRVDGY